MAQHNKDRLNVRICTVGVPANALPSALFMTSVLVFSRFVVVNNVFVTEGMSTDDGVDDDCSASPLHFNACSLDIYHIHRHIVKISTDVQMYVTHLTIN